MTSTFAVRTRPFTSPYPIDSLRADAVAHRKDYNKKRKAEIKRLISTAPSDKKEEFYWTMVYDLELAPTSTTRALLLEQGIIPVPPQELSSVDMHDELWTIIEAMSNCGIFLLNTDHLSDRDLYCRLYYKILDESVRMMPPASEAAEFIDCLHSMDLEYPLGRALLSRGQAVPSKAPYFRGPQVYSVPGQLGDRDAYLPKPKGF